MNDHIAGEDLAAYVDGKLEGGKKMELESHFSQCPECLETLAEIFDIRNSRRKIPGEFLQQALGEKQAARKLVLPLRLVFEIAAAFLVVVFIGYFFLSNNRFWRSATAQKENSDRVTAGAVSRTPAGAGKSGPSFAGKAEPAEYVKAKEMPVEKNVRRAPAPILPPQEKPDLAAAVKDRKSAPVDENEIRERGQKLEEAAAQPLQAEADKSGDAQWVRSRSTEMTASGGTAQPALAAKAQAAPPAGKGIADAALLARAAGYEMGVEKSFRSRSRAAAAIAGAAQLFLAATGRAAAPLGIDMAALMPPRLLIEGEAGRADLLDPELLEGWSWFKKGMILELELDGAGAVTAVIPLGQWERSLVARAEKAARQLTFSISGKKSRRARISVSASAPN